MVNPRFAEEHAGGDLDSWNDADCFAGSARDFGLPSLPSTCDGWSQPGYACVAALHRLWPLLPGGGWYSGHARASCDRRASAGVRVRFLFALLTSFEQISLLVISVLKGKRRERTGHHFGTGFPRNDAVHWKSRGWRFGLLVEMIRVSDTSCRAFQHQMSRL